MTNRKSLFDKYIQAYAAAFSFGKAHIHLKLFLIYVFGKAFVGLSMEGHTSISTWLILLVLVFSLFLDAMKLSDIEHI